MQRTAPSGAESGIRSGITALLAALLLAWPTAAETYPRPPVTARYEGIVTRVVDGDGLVLLTPRGEVTIRLQGIDAPEVGQRCEDERGAAYACGIVARDRLAALALRRRAVCETPSDDPTDRYGRELAFCTVGAVDLNITLLEEGHALAYRRFLGTRPHAAAYRAAEARARTARRGLWRGLFTPPWDWRARRQG